MLIDMLARFRFSRAIAGLPDRLRRDVGVEPTRVPRSFLPELPPETCQEARLRRLIGVNLLRR